MFRRFFVTHRHDIVRESHERLEDSRLLVGKGNRTSLRKFKENSHQAAGVPTRQNRGVIIRRLRPGGPNRMIMYSRCQPTPNPPELALAGGSLDHALESGGGNG